ncbi:MAG: PorV/PorQ family protein [Candidatus Kryptoniota bacterium]
MKFIFLLSTLFVGQIAYSQTIYRFLNLDVSAREASLAGASLARTSDPSGFFYNPAVSVNAGNRIVTFGFLKHILDINAGYVFATAEKPAIGYFGIGIGYINYGSFTTTDEFGNQLGTFSAGDAMLVLNYSNLLAEDFSYGFNLKGIYSSIASARSSAIAFDAGLYYNFPSNMLGIGFSIDNIGAQLDYYGGSRESLPLNVRIGVTKQLEHLPLVLNVALQHLADSDLSLSDKLSSFAVGGEFLLSDNLELRIGYDNLKHKQMKIGVNSGLEGMSFGLGLKVAGYTFDYSFSSWGKIGALHRVNVTTAI